MYHLNGHISLNSLARTVLAMPEMLRPVAVHSLCSFCKITYEKAITELVIRDCNFSKIDRMWSTRNSIFAHSSTKRDNESVDMWFFQQDATQRLSGFRRPSNERCRTIWLNPDNAFVTVIDDVYETKAPDNKIKSISNCKADRAERSADVIFDAIFRLNLGLRFCRRGESQSHIFKKPLGCFVDRQDELLLHEMIATANRGYGSLKLLRAPCRERCLESWLWPIVSYRITPSVPRNVLVWKCVTERPSDFTLCKTSTMHQRVGILLKLTLFPTKGSLTSSHLIDDRSLLFWTLLTAFVEPCLLQNDLGSKPLVAPNCVVSRLQQLLCTSMVA